MSEQNDTATAPEASQDLIMRAEKAERERDDYLNLAKQVKADFDNYQKAQSTRPRSRTALFASLPWPSRSSRRWTTWIAP